MPELIENLCTRCWGRGTKRDGPTLDCGYGYGICPRCKGTGEEPDRFSWPVIALCIIILVVGLYAAWSIK